MGAAPGNLIILPIHRKTTTDQPSGTIMDFIPIVNIPSFGMCMSPANPMVASATAAAMGVLTPMPCVPMTTSPWTPGSPNVTISGIPAIDQADMLMCEWAGLITVNQAGQVTQTVS
jgi:Domain of unknown function (DUF4280)